MTKKEAENKLVEAIRNLERATEKVVQSQGYTHDAKKMKILAELIKEQIQNENKNSLSSVS